MSGTTFLNTLLEKTSDWDKDERYMATNDLCNELTKDVKIDENMERRICAAVLKQLDDQSNDVQSVAVKCLAIILKKVHQTQVGEICDKLCALILEGKDALRDIYSIGLKTLIADVPDEMGMLVSERLTGRLLNGITRTGSDDTKRECLDNMADLLRRFGHLIARDHDDIMNAVVRQLNHEKSGLQKRAAVCLGSLAVVSSDSLLNKLVELILGKIDTAEKKSKGSTEARTLIQTIGTISRTVGYRLGRHLDRLVPLFLRFCGRPDEEGSQNESADELREHCLPGLESFVLRCPREVSPYISSILAVALGFMKYDPNYSYDEEVNTFYTTSLSFFPSSILLLSSLSSLSLLSSLPFLFPFSYLSSLLILFLSLLFVLSYCLLLHLSCRLITFLFVLTVCVFHYFVMLSSLILTSYLLLFVLLIHQ
jgi:cullin-associated NEDD8-dissociated protein 1